MTRAQRLQPVQKLVDQNERRLAQSLAALERRLSDSETKLTELQRYRQEYESQFGARAGLGIGATELRDYQAFLARLSEAVRQQNSLVQRARIERDLERTRWQEAATRAKAVDHVIERWHDEDRRASGSPRSTRERRARPAQGTSTMTPTITTIPSPVGATQPVSPTATGNVAPADFMMLLAQIVGQPAQQAITPLATPMAPLPKNTSDLPDSEDTAQPDATELLPLVLPFIGPASTFDAQAVSAANAILSGVGQRMEQGATRATFDVQLVTDMIQAEQSATSEVTSAEGDVFQLPIASTASAQAHKHHIASDMISRPIQVPVGNAKWADELGARLTTMTEQGRHAASLRLSPEHLGPLEIRIAIRDDQASVWFGAAHADTRAAIEHALPRLRDMFEAQGMSLADAGVFHEAPREQPHSPANKASADSHTSPADEPASIPVRVNIGLVDAYA